MTVHRSRRRLSTRGCVCYVLLSSLLRNRGNDDVATAAVAAPAVGGVGGSGGEVDDRYGDLPTDVVVSEDDDQYHQNNAVVRTMLSRYPFPDSSSPHQFVTPMQQPQSSPSQPSSSTWRRQLSTRIRLRRRMQQQQGCIGTYETLRARLLDASPREVIRLCARRTIVVEAEMPCEADNVVIRCVGGPAKSCVLDRGGEIFGRILNLSGNDVTIDGVAFRNADNDGNGGAVYLSGAGTHNVRNCLFQDNEAANGGGIFAENGVVNIHNTEFIRNIVQRRGGAAEVFQLGTLTRDGLGTGGFTANSAQFCGNIYELATGLCRDVVAESGGSPPNPPPISFPTFSPWPTPVINPSTFSPSPDNRLACVGTYDTLRDRISDAFPGEVIPICPGRINVDDELSITGGDETDGITLTCVGVDHSCVLRRRGRGRILSVEDERSVTLHGLAFDGAMNYGGNGGALNLRGGGSRWIQDCLFRNNYADNGGAIYTTGGTTTIVNSEFVNNSARRGGAVNGDALVGSYGNRGSNNQASQCSDILSAGLCIEFSNDEAPFPAPLLAPVLAPIVNPTDNDDCISQFDILKVALEGAANGDEVRMCPLTMTVDDEDGIAVTADGLTLRCAGSPTSCVLRRRRRADTSGGRILTVTGFGITVQGITFREAMTENGNGGAVLVSGGGDVTFRECYFRDNSASGNGGALYVQNSSTNLVLSFCQFSGNFASSNGGGLFVAGANQVTMQSDDFDSNSANNGGGGFSLRNVSTGITIGGCIVATNEANQGGGAVIVNSGTTLVDGTIFESNRSETNIGGLRLSNTNIEIDDCEFRKNFAKSNAGGTALQGGNRYSATIRNTLFDNNEAQSGFGGGLSISIPYSFVESSIFCYNRAQTIGGAAYLASTPRSGNVGVSNDANNCNDIWVVTGRCLSVTLGGSSRCSDGYVLHSSGHVVQNQIQPISSARSVGATSVLRLSDLDQEEIEKISHLIEFHIKEIIELYIAVPVHYVEMHISDLALDSADAGNHFFVEVAFDGIPVQRGRALRSNDLDYFVSLSFRDRRGRVFIELLKMLAGRLGRVVDFDVSPVRSQPQISSQEFDAADADDPSSQLPVRPSDAFDNENDAGKVPPPERPTMLDSPPPALEDVASFGRPPSRPDQPEFDASEDFFDGSSYRY